MWGDGTRKVYEYYSWQTKTNINQQNEGNKKNPVSLEKPSKPVNSRKPLKSSDRAIQSRECPIGSGHALSTGKLDLFCAAGESIGRPGWRFNWILLPPKSTPNVLPKGHFEKVTCVNFLFRRHFQRLVF